MLKGKTPIIPEMPRFKVIVFGAAGAGKSKFACSFKNAYIHGSENITEYKHFAQQIKENGSVYQEVNTIDEVIEEVKDLLSTKHQFTTYVWDSPSPLYAAMCMLEAERLAKKDGSDGDEFQRNTSKPKRKLAHLGFLFSRLDMNIIITSHEKPKFDNGKEIGMTFDIPDKMGYALGCVLHLTLQGKNRKARVIKTRYDKELPQNELIDFTIDGHAEICNRLGLSVFDKQSVSDPLATPKQVDDFMHLCQGLKVSEERLQEWLLRGKASIPSELSEKNIQVLINLLQSKLNEKLNNQAMKEAA